jgi:hypothetical protein
MARLTSGQTPPNGAPERALGGLFRPGGRCNILRCEVDEMFPARLITTNDTPPGDH